MGSCAADSDVSCGVNGREDAAGTISCWVVVFLLNGPELRPSTAMVHGGMRANPI